MSKHFRSLMLAGADGRGVRTFTRVLALLVQLSRLLAWSSLGLMIAVALFSLLASLVPGAALPGFIARLSLDDPQARLIWAAGTVFCAAAIFLLSLLRRILTTLAEGDPFVPGNAMRLRQIAIVLAALELGRIGLSLVLGAKPGTNAMVWLGIAVLIILAQVFAEGSALREDRNLTI